MLRSGKIATHFEFRRAAARPLLGSSRAVSWSTLDDQAPAAESKIHRRKAVQGLGNAGGILAGRTPSHSDARGCSLKLLI